MDLHHPHLIGDCLIHIFTFLNEEDLIIASGVCKVSSVQLAEVAHNTEHNVIISPPKKCLIIIYF